MSRLVSTTFYVTDADDLTGGEYTVDDDLYLNLTTLAVTNKAADQLVSLAVIGSLVEAPDLTGTGLPDRLVLRLTVTDEHLDPIKRLINSLDL